tara:strand:- start:910 stop:1038 length:129 start_codon:yes stop_codon:yes gene_type:complete
MDMESGEPLIGATAMLSGSSTGATTDKNGHLLSGELKMELIH